MRITGGELRSRQLAAPRGDATRPTSDRVREALFSILTTQVELEGARVLDLFCGSGALATGVTSIASPPAATPTSEDAPASSSARTSDAPRSSSPTPSPLLPLPLSPAPACFAATLLRVIIRVIDGAELSKRVCIRAIIAAAGANAALMAR